MVSEVFINPLFREMIHLTSYELCFKWVEITNEKNVS